MHVYSKIQSNLPLFPRSCSPQVLPIWPLPTPCLFVIVVVVDNPVSLTCDACRCVGMEPSMGNMPVAILPKQ